jgi:hypothetical protein
MEQWTVELGDLEDPPDWYHGIVVELRLTRISNKLVAVLRRQTHGRRFR